MEITIRGHLQSPEPVQKIRETDPQWQLEGFTVLHIIKTYLDDSVGNMLHQLNRTALDRLAKPAVKKIIIPAVTTIGDVGSSLIRFVDPDTDYTIKNAREER